MTSPNLADANVDLLGDVTLISGAGLTVGYDHSSNNPNAYGVTLLALAEPCCTAPRPPRANHSHG